MKHLIKYLSVIILCLSAFLFIGCANGEYMVAYDTTPIVYYYPYPANPYHYYVPRRVYTRPTPPPQHRPVVTPKPKPHGNTPAKPNTNNRGGNNNNRNFGGRR